MAQDNKSSRLANLSADKRALLEKRLRGGGQKRTDRTIAKRPTGESVPLSFAQQRLWFMDRMSPGDSNYNMTRVLRIEGPLQTTILEVALQELVDRHEALRTTFQQGDEGQPIQTVAPAARLALCKRDMRAHLAEERTRAALELVRKAGNESFSLTNGPLFKAHLLHMDDQEHWLQLTMHHIISDGLSFGLVAEEFGALYEAFAAGKPSPLEPLELHYADYTVWQHQQLNDQAMEKQLAYWEQKLQGAEPLFEMPADHPRPAVQSSSGAFYEIDFPTGTLEALKKLSTETGNSLFITLLAAFKTLLMRYTGQEDIILGCPVATRTQESERMIGFFINSVVMRTTMSNDLSFREVLGRVRDTALEAYSNLDVPFERVVERVQPVRDLSYSPLYQIEFQTEMSSDFAISGLQVTTIPVDLGKARFDLSVSIAEATDRLSASFEYCTDLFESETIERMANHFAMLLQGIAADPEQKLADLPLLTEKEHRQLVEEWNCNQHPFPEDKCLHQLVEEQVSRTPNRIAAVFGEETLTYEQLNAEANRLAHDLRSLGVGPDRAVAVCMERSLDLVVALLGVLKAGGAYLPIDTEAPPERIRQLIEDSEAVVCLTQTSLQPGLPLDATRMVFLDRERERLALMPTHNPEQNVTPDHLVSLYYTSGSTGKPKGVANLHKGWVNRMTWMQRYHQMQPDETILQKTVLTFDDSAVEFFWPLICGGRIALIEPGMHRDPQAILEAAIRYEVAIIQFVPSVLDLFYQCITSEDRQKLCKLRTLISSGEALKPELVRTHLERLPHATLYNQWGPTEVSIDATVHRCGPEDITRGEILSIGRPIDNVQLYILDSQLKPVPVGVTGELYLTGIGLARGYLNNPEKTAEAFLPNCFDLTSEYMYKTGDRGFYLPDGSIIFVGRLDDQVKIRGIRIELGEIEAVLIEHPFIQSAAVIAYEATPGNKRLFAYVVTDAGRVLKADEIETYLKERLPHYMVPGRIVALQDIPLTANGKVDRKALKQLAMNDSVEEVREHVAPSTTTEKKLSEIWAAVLKRDQVSATDHFFEIGGHSLLAVQILNRIRKEFNVTVELKEMFVHGMLKQLAARIDALLEESAQRVEIELAPLGKQEHYELSHAQQRLWILYKFDPASRVYHVPSLYEHQGPLCIETLQAALQSVLQRHDSLRTRFIEVDGQPRQMVLEQSPLRLIVRDVSGLMIDQQNEFVHREMEASAGLPFDLTEEPPIRAILFKRSEEFYQFYLNMHHIITDGWSEDVFFADLSAAYEALSDGNEPFAVPLPVQYADYSAWQKRQQQSGEWKKQEDFWLNTMVKPLPVLELPTDFARPETFTANGAVLETRGSRQVAEAVQAVGAAQGVSPYMVLLAAYAMMLHELTESDDLIIGTPVAGRSREELEGMIGFFVNTLPIRIRFNHVRSLEDLLREVKGKFLDAFEHQDYPFDLLVEKVNPIRDTSRTPLFSTAFLYRLEEANATSNQRLRFEPSLDERAQVAAKMDLNLVAIQTDEGLRFAYVYNTDLFRRETIERFDALFRNVLQGFVTQLTAPLETLDLLPEQDLAIYERINDTSRPLQNAGTIGEAFCQQAERHAERLAVSDGHLALTYRELHARSNQLARLLQQEGVQSGELVGIMMGRNVHVITAMLGILKAGAAFLPIDPDYPEERIRYMLSDSGARMLIIEEEQRGSLPVAGVTILTLSDIPDGTSEENLLTGGTADDLAYSIYTSGSTGLPKGVLLRHAGVLNLAQWKREEHGYSEHEIVLQFSSYSFDASVWEIFPALLNGAHLHILSGEQRQTVSAFADAVAKAQATDVTLPTVFFNQLGMHLKESDREKIRSLKRIFVAGEALQPAIIHAWRQRFGRDIGIVNAYGPTESTVCATAYRVGELAAEQTTVPIGTPLQNFRSYILNHRQQLCPVSVPGELYVEGIGLAAGYRNLPEKTSEAFLPHPFKPGSVVYKTGDIVRLRRDGLIEFLGRRDAQVKVRGHRVEIGEIEECILQHEAIEVAAVIVNQDASGNNSLIAYYATGEGLLPASVVRSELSAKMPSYMLPSQFIQLSQMPMLPNGKVDRKSLEGIILEQIAPSDRRVSPETATEIALAAIWRELLRTDLLSIEDSFFDLGGHSLLVIQLQNRIEHALRVTLSMKDVFQHPYLGQMAAHIDSLSAGESVQIAKLAPQANYALSQAQKRLWFYYKLDPGNRGYDVATMGVHRGPFDMNTFEAAFQAVVDRHDALRTHFLEVDGEPRQAVLAEMSSPLQVRDISGLPRDHQAEFIRLKVQEINAEPFDLTQEPLLRAILFKRADDEHQLYLNMPHIITDGWSFDVFYRDLSHAYQSLQKGSKPWASPLRLQYVDYAAWQEEELAKGNWEEQERYWLDKLSKPLPVLELPTDYPRPDVMTFNGGIVKASVGLDLSVQLRDLAKRMDMSLYMILLAAHAMMLHTLTEDRDLIIGTPVAGRSAAEFEEMIGFFVNTLPVRINLAGVRTLEELLHVVKREFLSAFERQDYPFDLMVEKVNPVRDTSRSPLFSTLFSYYTKGATARTLDTLHFGPVEDSLENATAKIDVNLFALDAADGIELSYEYNTDLFKQESIERFDAIFRNVIQALVAQLNAPLAELDLLPEQDRAVYERINDSERPFPSEKTIHEAFYEKATVHAERPAVSDGREVLTYTELNARSNQMARLLQEKGIARGHRVGIMMERGVLAVTAMIAALKAGASYVAVDPDYPGERICYMLSDSGAQLLISEAHLCERLALDGMTVVAFSDIPNDLSAENLPLEGTANDPAYVIYTSGSTGLPKGVLLRHVGVLNFAHWLHEEHRYEERDVILQFSSYSFDASIWEIFSALLNGAHLHILTGEQRQAPAAFAEAVSAVQGTCVLLPTVFFNHLGQLLNREDQAKLRSLKRIFVGGEALQPEVLRGWYRRFGREIEIINAYGPSEATVVTTTERAGELADELVSVPIGKPLPNFRVFVLNGYGQLCPVNVPGELHIESVGLALEYLNQPEKTSEAFLPHPFRQGHVLYKTGDIVRLLPDGRLDYVGRRDTQLKVRGHRVEIGEVEERILQHSGVENAAVVVSRDASGNNSLIAYYTSPNHLLAVNDLRSELSTKMPAYMMPSQFKQLEHMPLMPSGKVDRKALSAQKSLEVAAVVPVSLPKPESSRVEDDLISIWADCLQKDRSEIGLDDNFFDVGGHSLLLAKMQELIRGTFQVKLPLTDLFKYTTIRMLAKKLGQDAAQVAQATTDHSHSKAREHEAIAIIGMGLRFPQATNAYELWDHLREGRELVEDIRPEELPFRLDELDEETLEKLVLRGGYLEDVDKFDPEFFSMTQKEASDLDPQQRMFLLCAWEAIENGGYHVDGIGSRTSLYAGISDPQYNPQSALANGDASDRFQAEMSSLKKLVATRTSYKLNLKGESLVIETACSTSLVAVHMACQSLLSGQSDYALAGGACVAVEKSGYVYEPGFILSPDGKCRPFDASASGTAGGSGVGVVLLKRLSDAVRDRDPIYAVIKGSAINNDGNVKIGFTAPSQQGQADVIRKAHAAAGVDPSTITYVETHGTGTRLGDPIEIAALKEAFGDLPQKQHCAIGSIKANIGHTDTAAGIAGLIKVALSLKFGELAPTINFDAPNPECGFDDSPFYVNTELKVWSRQQGSRRAGVSSFGIGGTNAHVVLEEAPIEVR